MAPGDCDGDGSLAPECGGDDCDDGDANRRPGNPEICDSEGHDEDCDPSTLGSTDDDGDGAISMACCNGATCGTDCDDASSEVAPSASEICNGIDDDCDGTIDIASASLCPGGLCLGGRCAFDAWDASFGTADDDAANAVAIDAAGNVYVAGHVGSGTVDFGGDPRTVAALRESIAVVKFGPDGRYLWDYVSPGLGSALVTGIAVDPAGTRVYVVGHSSGDLGSGHRNAPFLLVVDGSGGYLMDRRFGAAHDVLNDVAVHPDGVIAIGKFWQTVDFGGGEVSLGTRETMVLVQFDGDGTYLREHVFPSSDGYSVGYSVAIGPSGEIAVGGVYTGTFALGSSLDGRGAFVAILTAAGAPMWAHAIRAVDAVGTQRVHGVAIGAGGRVYGVGEYTRSIDPGTGTVFGSSSGANGFVVALAADGTPEWARSFGDTGGDDRATDVAVHAGGDVSIVGEFSTVTDFGRGLRTPVSEVGFLARYGSDGEPIRDVVYSVPDGSTGSTRVESVAIGPGASTVICGLFGGTANFGSGSRPSYGGTDWFVLRLGS